MKLLNEVELSSTTSTCSIDSDPVRTEHKRIVDKYDDECDNTCLECDMAIRTPVCILGRELIVVAFEGEVTIHGVVKFFFFTARLSVIKEFPNCK